MVCAPTVVRGSSASEQCRHGCRFFLPARRHRRPSAIYYYYRGQLYSIAVIHGIIDVCVSFAHCHR